ncbi:hypothetical protein C9890_0024 [Perkinsus sp. BL_2016]|nr:hypothetical protein C9890_0024 [Perkinsus sp. BL_2016]
MLNSVSNIVCIYIFVILEFSVAHRRVTREVYKDLRFRIDPQAAIARGEWSVSLMENSEKVLPTHFVSTNRHPTWRDWTG